MIYLSFIGNHDRLKKSSTDYGATISIFLRYKEEIEKVYLFVTQNKGSVEINYHEIAISNKEYLKEEKPELDIELIPIEIDNPIDFDLIYPKMLDLVTTLQEDDEIANSDKIVNITSGTPTMTTCWVLLNQSGILSKSILVQSFERKHAVKRGGFTQEVNFKIDDFPQIKVPSAIKRQLTIVNREKESLNRKVKEHEIDERIPDLIGVSKQIREIKEQIIYDLNSDTHVLILGERGTGKQVIADSVWKLYHKENEDQLLTFDCGTFSKELVTAELFGFKKGSFTGAIQDKKGIVEIANERFLFLDEIGNLPLEGQNSLLRLINDGEFREIGADKVKNIRLTVIAATNKNINDSTLFALDLKDRFDEIINLPPLRERTEDIPILTEYFAKIYSKSSNLLHPLVLDQDIVKKLIDYDWPGNVRELEKWIQRCIRRYNGGLLKLNSLPTRFIADIINDDKLDDDLPQLPIKMNLEEYVEQIRNKARRLAGGNMSEVDRLLNQQTGTEKQRQYRKNKKN